MINRIEVLTDVIGFYDGVNFVLGINKVDFGTFAPTSANILTIHTLSNNTVQLLASEITDPQTFANSEELFLFFQDILGTGGGTTYTFENGLTESGGVVKLGGVANEPINIQTTTFFNLTGVIGGIARGIIDLYNFYFQETGASSFNKSFNIQDLRMQVIENATNYFTYIGFGRNIKTEKELLIGSNDPLFKGIAYNNDSVDPTPNFTDFSLVHKKYVGDEITNALNGLTSGLTFLGAWNASTNTPTLTSSVGTDETYYRVTVAGSTSLDGVSDWNAGDWVVFLAGVWTKVDNTDNIVSVNGQNGIVVLTKTDVGLANVDNTSDLQKQDDYLYNPNTLKVIQDDFCSGTETGEWGTQGWNLSAGTNTFVITSASNELDHVGVGIKTTTTINAVSTLGLVLGNARNIHSSNLKKQLWIIKPIQLTQYAFFIGFQSDINNNPNVSLATYNFGLRKNLANANYEIVYRNNGVQQTLDTGILAVASQWLVFEFERVSATVWQWRIAETFASLGSFNVITSAQLPNNINLNFGISDVSLDGTAKSIAFDYFAMSYLCSR